jgi:co-chaperonin GroES (HSP10)
MLKPLHDKILVELDESIPNQAGLIIPIRVDRWTAKDGAIESYNRGTVVACGPGKRHPKTGEPQRMEFRSPEGLRPVHAGDVIRFSELEFYEHKEDGRRYALIGESDIVGVEVEEAQ